MHKQDGMPFGARGPEGMDNGSSKANELGGAKGMGMKHVVSPGADGGGMNPQDDMKKKMLMMLIAQAKMGQGGGAPMGGGQPMGGQPMGGAPMGGGGGY